MGSGKTNAKVREANNKKEYRKLTFALDEIFSF
jgi:hypothetical protein